MADRRRRIATVGVYGSTGERYIQTLRGAEVGLVIDVRQRRGVRGPEYSWANAVRLQRLLDEAEIGYRHVKDLAPTTELRGLQYAIDDAAGVGKRSRERLADAYVAAYRDQILDRFPFDAFVSSLPSDRLPALMCVERDPQACHRSLVAQRLADRHGFTVSDLRP